MFFENFLHHCQKLTKSSLTFASENKEKERVNVIAQKIKVLNCCSIISKVQKEIGSSRDAPIFYFLTSRLKYEMQF